MENKGIVTKDLKAAIKNSTCVSIRITPGKAEIICQKEVRKVKGFSGKIEARFNGFAGSLPEGFASAWFSDPVYSKATGNYAVLERLIRPGDNLSFRCFDNSSLLIKKAKMFSDTLYVTIHRKEKAIIKDFEIDSCVCLNNTARRMIEYDPVPAPNKPKSQKKKSK